MWKFHHQGPARQNNCYFPPLSRGKSVNQLIWFKRTGPHAGLLQSLGRPWDSCPDPSPVEWGQPGPGQTARSVGQLRGKILESPHRKPGAGSCEGSWSPVSPTHPALAL